MARASEFGKIAFYEVKTSSINGGNRLENARQVSDFGWHGGSSIQRCMKSYTSMGYLNATRLAQKSLVKDECQLPLEVWSETLGGSSELSHYTCYYTPLHPRHPFPGSFKCSQLLRCNFPPMSRWKSFVGQQKLPIFRSKEENEARHATLIRFIRIIQFAVLVFKDISMQNSGSDRIVSR